MRKINLVRKIVILESDISQKKIYAFKYRDDISFLCKKDGKFFWKFFGAVELVCKKNYDSIEEAISNVIDDVTFIVSDCGVINEFDSTKEMITWAFFELNPLTINSEHNPNESIVRGVSPLKFDKNKVESPVCLFNKKKPYVQIGENIPSSHWYSNLNGFYFNVRTSNSRSDVMEMEGFGGVDLDTILIVTDNEEFGGNAILKSHCSIFITNW